MKIIESPYSKYKCIVYKITCLINGKLYFGSTRNGIIDRTKKHWHRHQSKFYQHLKLYKAFKKYGWENFTIEIVYHALTEKEVQRIEDFFILKYKTLEHKNGYNMVLNTEKGLQNYCKESLECQQSTHTDNVFNRIQLNKCGLYGVRFDKVYIVYLKQLRFCSTNRNDAAYIADLAMLYFFKRSEKLNSPEKIEEYKNKNLFEEIKKIKDAKMPLKHTSFKEITIHIKDIIDMYINQKLSALKIAQKYNTDHSIIRKALKHNGIKIRTQKEARNIKKMSSIYTGVSKTKQNKYYSHILINRRHYNLGTFDNEVNAAEAYDFEIIKHNLPKDKLNFPEKEDQYRKRLDANKD